MMSLRLKFLTICTSGALLCTTALLSLSCSFTHLSAQVPFTVVIDAGHGGHDSGCQGHSRIEKNVALELALLTGQLIKDASPTIKVVYTRETDVFIPLNDRIKIANDIDADLFVSIHCNSASRKSQATGTETFVMGLHSSQENLEVAKRENSSILLEKNYEANYDGFDPYTIEGHILLSAIQNNYLNKSIELAAAVQDKLTELTPLRNRGVKQAGFLLLRKATMPSILVESAFLSNEDDAKYISTQNGLLKVSTAIAEGIILYYHKSIQEKADLIASNGPAYQSNHSKPGTKSDVGSKITKTLSSKNTVVKKESEEPLAEKVVYSIQIASMTKPFKPEVDPVFSKLDDIVERVEEDLYKYTAGQYQKLEEALAAREEIRSKGIKGAFVVAYQGNKRIKL